jgi:hypothetical protein
MKFKSILILSFMSIGMLGFASSAYSKIEPLKDPRAMAELQKMGQALAQAKTLSFNESSTTPIRGPNGQWLHILKTAKVELQRPNSLFVETGGDAFLQKIYFDGKTFSVSAPEHQLYSQEEMPGDIDAMLAMAAKKSGDAFTFSDVLISDPLATWTKDLDGALFVGESMHGNEKLAHLAFTAKDVDWEMWVNQKDHLPRMVYVKYIGVEKTPSLMIEFTKWKVNAPIPASVFNFVAPANAKKAKLKAPEGANS